VRKLEKRNANLQDIVKLYQTSVQLLVIKSCPERSEGAFSSLIKERYTDAFEFWTDEEHLTRFAALVEAEVDLDQLDNGEYMISAGYDSSLLALKDEHG